MKTRMGYTFTNPQTPWTSWVGDCPRWAAITRKYNPDAKEGRIKIIGTFTNPCHYGCGMKH